MYKDALIEKFQFLKEIFNDNDTFFINNVTYKKYKDKELIVGPSDQCEGIPLILKGQIRLFHISKSGREMKVFNVEEGQACILAAVCMLSDIEYDFLAHAEDDTIIAVLSPMLFHSAMGKSNAFRNFVLTEVANKLINTVNLLYDINFSSIEARLINYLKHNISVNNELNITHESLAIELGTSREVVSRQLKRLEKNGVLILKRGSIKIISELKEQ